MYKPTFPCLFTLDRVSARGEEQPGPHLRELYGSFKTQPDVGPGHHERLGADIVACFGWRERRPLLAEKLT